MFRGLDQRYVAHSLDDIDFAAAARQDRRRDRRRLDGGRLRGRSAGSRRGARRHAGAARRRAAHQQEHGHRQRGLLDRLPRLTDAQKFADRGLHRRARPCRRRAARCCAVRGTRTSRSWRAARCARRRDRATAACCSTPRAARSPSTSSSSATGLTVDWSQRPEFAALEATMSLLWRDRFAPQGGADYAQAEHPYRRPRVRVPRASTRRRAVGRAHPLLQLRRRP